MKIRLRGVLELLQAGIDVFLTDVDGVFTKDPRIDPRARLLRTIQVEPNTANIVAADFEASGSSHAHDVTGGLEVSCMLCFYYGGRFS